MPERIVYLKTGGAYWHVCPSEKGADLAIFCEGDVPAEDVARLANRTLIAAPLAKHPHRVNLDELGAEKVVNLYAKAALAEEDSLQGAIDFGKSAHLQDWPPRGNEL